MNWQDWLQMTAARLRHPPPSAFRPLPTLMPQILQLMELSSPVQSLLQNLNPALSVEQQLQAFYCEFLIKTLALRKRLRVTKCLRQQSSSTIFLNCIFSASTLRVSSQLGNSTFVAATTSDWSSMWTEEAGPNDQTRKGEFDKQLEELVSSFLQQFPSKNACIVRKNCAHPRHDMLNGRKLAKRMNERRSISNNYPAIFHQKTSFSRTI